MDKPLQICVRIDHALKNEAEQILADIGFTPAEAIRLFYRQVYLQAGLPFEVRIPNAETLAAISDARSRKNLKKIKRAF